MHVLAAASEIYPLIKTGGLADVVGALPKALMSKAVSTRTIIPGYRQIFDKLTNLRHEADVDLMGMKAEFLSGSYDNLEIIVVKSPALYERDGGPYLDQNGRDHPDNWKRFAALSRATALVAAQGLNGWRPDIVHLHDWQTALAAAYLKIVNDALPVMLSIHNLAFQGQFPAAIFQELDLPQALFSTEGIEYYGGVSFLKAGVKFSDSVTTVSPTYAREILTDDLGMGMQGMLSTRRDDLTGIVNGIDMDVWNPATDDSIPVNYDSRTIGRRAGNRSRIEERFNLLPGRGPILSVISRLTWQKGIDLLKPVIPGIIDRGSRLIVYGQGDPDIIHPLIEESWRYPGLFAIHVGFCENDAHLLHAGSDIVVQPSRFEPCGLTQLYALRYGAIPIVARTGGLAETIIDANDAAMTARVATGFQFQSGSVEDLYHAIDRALTGFRRAPFWRRLQTQAMKADFSWTRSAGRYADLYTALQSRPY
ncbi:glycogen synthase GlgA [Rhizobium sp. LjRoot98]|uniref:glycogen synthase GlgA n=1 Tax=unclassified Rhizobium TaxID=2613769 RepID=UPI000713DB67|nr:glycogen synthase GlgA [Rhizobium sp. Root1204]KQV33267.1 glycogen synthase [Rhizobium sp. Root1204]